MENKELKERLSQHGLYHWQLAEELGISEYTLCRWMRHELPPKRKAAALEAIDRIIARRKGEGNDD